MTTAKILIETLLETSRPGDWEKGPLQAKEYVKNPCFVSLCYLSVLPENNPSVRNCAEVVQIGKTEFTENLKEERAIEGNMFILWRN